MIVIGYGSYAGEAAATHVMRNGSIFSLMEEFEQDNGKVIKDIDTPILLERWDN